SEPHIPGRERCKLSKYILRGHPIGLVRTENQQLTLGKICEVGEVEQAVALFIAVAKVASAQQSTEPAIGFAIGWIGDDLRRDVVEDQTDTDHIAEVRSALPEV